MRECRLRSIFSLKKEDAGNLLNFSKGIAILLVIFHHFSRSLWFSRGLEAPALQQWNFNPMARGFGLIISSASAGHYSNTFLFLMAQFGYVGVHLFVLMSGLGLAFGTSETIALGPFLKRRFRKLVPPFWTAVAFFMVLGAVFGQPYSAGQIVERMFLLTTFDQTQFFIIDSPMWCLAVFFQLYFLFLPMRWLIHRFGPRIVLLLAVIAFIARWLMSFSPILQWNMFLGHTFAFNWLAVFGLGIWIGGKLRQDGKVELPVWMVTGTTLAATLLLFLADRYGAVYPVHDTAIGIVIGTATLLTWSVLIKTHLAHALATVGGISFPLYLYHRPIVGILVALWRASSIKPFLPELGLGLVIVASLLTLTLLTRQVLRLNPKIASYAFGDAKGTSVPDCIPEFPRSAT